MYNTRPSRSWSDGSRDGIVDPARQQGEIEEDNIFHSIGSNTVVLLRLRYAQRAARRQPGEISWRMIETCHMCSNDVRCRKIEPERC